MQETGDGGAVTIDITDGNKEQNYFLNISKILIFKGKMGARVFHYFFLFWFFFV